MNISISLILEEENTNENGFSHIVSEIKRILDEDTEVFKYSYNVELESCFMKKCGDMGYVKDVTILTNLEEIKKSDKNVQ